MEGMIEVTEDKLLDIAKHAYDLSSPAGLGFLHFKEGGLSDDEARRLVERERKDSHVALSMDYVNGRGCKLTVFRRDGKLWLPKDRWFDHSKSQLDELHKRIGLTAQV